MKAKVVIQLHPATGHRNVCFSSNLLTDTKDLLAPWPSDAVVEGEVLILGDDQLIDALLTTELRSVDNTLDITPISLYIGSHDNTSSILN